jgi:Sialic acid synthase
MSVEIIAEVASNWGGDLALGQAFIDLFAAAGANTIKFQLTRVAHLRKDDPQYAWFSQVEAPIDHYAKLAKRCESQKVGFLLTAFNPHDVHWVAGLSDQIKVGSGEAQDGKLANEITSRTWSRILVSEGIRPVHRFYETHNAAILGCCSRYPSPVGMAYGRLSSSARYTGWSDHAVGLNECQMAITLGATIVETHVKLEGQPRPLQPWEKSVEDIRSLRKWANEDPARFLGRWQA